MIANAEGFLEVSELRRALERNRDLEVCIMDAYTKDWQQKSNAQPSGHAVRT